MHKTSSTHMRACPGLGLFSNALSSNSRQKYLSLKIKSEREHYIYHLRCWEVWPTAMQEEFCTGISNHRTSLSMSAENLRSVNIIKAIVKSNNLLTGQLADFGLARAKSVPTKTYSNEVSLRIFAILTFTTTLPVYIFRWWPCGTARLTFSWDQRSIPPLSTCGELGAFSMRWLLADRSSLDPRW